jgi:hypothetical protein
MHTDTQLDARNLMSSGTESCQKSILFPSTELNPSSVLCDHGTLLYGAPSQSSHSVALQNYH